jgi:hypothetical protein
VAAGVNYFTAASNEGRNFYEHSSSRYRPHCRA